MAFPTLLALLALPAFHSGQVLARPTLNSRQASPPSPSALSTLLCKRDIVKPLLPAIADIERIQAVTENSIYGEGASNLAYNGTTFELPSLCAVTVHVRNGSADPGSGFRFAVFLPDKWNGTFLTVGNGGFAGGINWLDMGPATWYGMATMSTDTGHSSTPTDLKWGYGDGGEARKLDWGWRAMHGSVLVAKELVAGYYGLAKGQEQAAAADTPPAASNVTAGPGTNTPAQPPPSKRAEKANITLSLYSGCSTGGRQGLKEIQLFPDSFDGALIGAPAWDTAHLMPWIQSLGTLTLLSTVNSTPTAVPWDYAPLAAAAIAVCDGLDGVADGIISNPDACNVEDLRARAQCGLPGVAPNFCLTEEQVDAALANIYEDWTNPATSLLVHPGMTVGSESGWWPYLYYGAINTTFDWDYDRYFLGRIRGNEADYDPRQVNLLSTVRESELQNPGQATAYPQSLEAFRRRGGKIIMYQGLADGTIPPRSTRNFYTGTRDAMRVDDKNMSSFFRLFELPGMGHCSSSAASLAGVPGAGRAPWFIGTAAGQELASWHKVGLRGHEGEAEWDVLLRLKEWVEKKEQAEPEHIRAVEWNVNNAPQVNGDIVRTRKICYFPYRQVLREGGDETKWEDWNCVL